MFICTVMFHLVSLFGSSVARSWRSVATGLTDSTAATALVKVVSDSCSGCQGQPQLGAVLGNSQFGSESQPVAAC